MGSAGEGPCAYLGQVSVDVQGYYSVCENSLPVQPVLRDAGILLDKLWREWVDKPCYPIQELKFGGVTQARLWGLSHGRAGRQKLPTCRLWSLPLCRVRHQTLPMSSKGDCRLSSCWVPSTQGVLKEAQRVTRLYHSKEADPSVPINAASVVHEGLRPCSRLARL